MATLTPSSFPSNDNVPLTPSTQSVRDEGEIAPVLIAGAGIGGLCLALALHKKCGLAGADIKVFEQSRSFRDNAGGAFGLYANGLRVLRDISPDLLATVRKEGYDYLYRRWFRHDGTEVAWYACGRIQLRTPIACTARALHCSEVPSSMRLVLAAPARMC